MKLTNVLFAASVLSLSATGFAKSEPNCEVKGKKIHVKDEAACTKKKGTWLAAPAAASAPAEKPADAAPAAAPAGEPAKH